MSNSVSFTTCFFVSALLHGVAFGGLVGLGAVWGAHSASDLKGVIEIRLEEDAGPGDPDISGEISKPLDGAVTQASLTIGRPKAAPGESDSNKSGQDNSIPEISSQDESQVKPDDQFSPKLVNFEPVIKQPAKRAKLARKEKAILSHSMVENKNEGTQVSSSSADNVPGTANTVATAAQGGGSIRSGGAISVLYGPKPSYPSLARRAGFEGDVTLDVVILADGTVEKAVVLRSSGREDCDESARKTILERWRFSRSGGISILPSSRERIVVSYRLR